MSSAEHLDAETSGTAVDIEAVMDLSDIIASLQDLSDDELKLRGLSVEGNLDEMDDPVLLGPDGEPVDKWRDGSPYSERMSRHEYEVTKRLLQIQLLKGQCQALLIIPAAPRPY